MPLPPDFLRQAEDALPRDLLSTDPLDLLTYGRDWTRALPPAPAAVAFPRSTEEVARLVRLCHDHRVTVVPSGGRTGLAGGAVAARGELVLSLMRMARMDAVDEAAQTVRVQAGAVTQAVHEHAARHGLTWPIDLAAKGQSHIGGNIATNAGGVRVIRYGLTRHWVLGLTAVTGTGEVLQLGGALEKNNTGYDLRQLFIGSEGTLGVITEATLKLCRPPERVAVLLLKVVDLPGVLRLFRAARRSPFVLQAFEFMGRSCVELLCRHRRLRDPLAQADGACYVLTEVELPAGAGPAALEEWLAGLLEEGLVGDGVVAQDERQARELWTLREGISESLSATGTVHKNDVALPIAALVPFCAELMELIPARYPGFEVFLFGHIGDGNLHINVRRPEGMDEAAFRARAGEVDHDLFRWVQRHGGSISAEHGIGLLKKPYLHYTRTAGEIALFRSIKQALDPRGILNPGKIFD
jgi:FAD/FMN-containing dehydrogenase